MFGERLRELRKEKGLSIQQAGEQFGISHAAVHKFESGKGYPTVDNLIRIANFFNVSTDYLLGRSNIRNAEEGEEMEKAFRFLTEYEQAHIGDGGEMHFVSANLLTAFEYSQHKENEKELGLLIKAVNDTIVGYNDLTRLRDSTSGQLGMNVLGYYHKWVTESLDNLNGILTRLFFKQNEG